MNRDTPSKGVGRQDERLTPALVICAALAVLVIAAATWYLAYSAGRRQAFVSLDSQLQVLSRSISSEIERYRYLPSILARDSRIQVVLQTREVGTLASANAYLKGVRADSGVDEVYVIGSDGVTVAASNHDEDSTFVGQNYRFRPYFQDAITGIHGQYYAIGATTGEPGYFLSTIIKAGNEPTGVAVVKVDLRPLERSWSEAGLVHAISDADGIVFLTSIADWRYRPLTVLSPATIARIDDSRQYIGAPVATASPLFGGAVEADEIELPDGGRYLLRWIAIEGRGWRLWTATPLAPIQSNALLLGSLAGLLAALVAGVGFFMRQRRHLARVRLEQHELLERRVVERTAELRAAQSSLIQAAKLAALGQMSATIVHEVSQPLAAMENTLATTGLLAERGDIAAVSSKVTQLRDLVRRIQRTVKSLKSFARNEPPHLAHVDVERAVTTAVELIENRTRPAGITIDIGPFEGPVIVSANALRLEQVFLNLLSNALDAVRDAPSPRIEVRSARTDGLVSVSVSDNGSGIAPEIAERIAEPFFTTKITGEGLGLGLSISRQILADFGGSLGFRSNPDGGSTFTVTLPELVPEAIAAE